MIQITSRRDSRRPARPQTVILGLLALLAFGCSKSETAEMHLADAEPAEADAVVVGDATGVVRAESKAAPGESDPGVRTWRTKAGATFEARLVWISKSGSALRFEKTDGESLLYAADHLVDEDRALIRDGGSVIVQK